MLHCRNLNFEEKPNYEYLSSLMIQIAEKEGIDLSDGNFDWVLKEQELGFSPFTLAQKQVTQHQNFTDYNKYKELKMKGFAQNNLFDMEFEMRHLAVRQANQA